MVTAFTQGPVIHTLHIVYYSISKLLFFNHLFNKEYDDIFC